MSGHLVIARPARASPNAIKNLCRFSGDHFVKRVIRVATVASDPEDAYDRLPGVLVRSHGSVHVLPQAPPFGNGLTRFQY